MGGGSCSDNTDENQTILIPQEALSVSIAADTGLKHTVSFEATDAWQASVQETRTDAWITIDPKSGNAGKNNMIVALTENTEETARKAVITILCGEKSVSITITQRGVGESEDPEDPEEPVNPEHPEVTPDNRLTYVEITQTEIYTSSQIAHEDINKDYIWLSYDAQGELSNFDYYTFDSEQTDKLDASYKTTIKRSANKISATEEYFEIYNNSSEDDIPYPSRGTSTTDYELNQSGLIAKYTDPDGDFTIFTYNADGTLSSMEFFSSSENNWKSTFIWTDGDLTSISTIRDGHSNTITYTYTEHLTPWQGVDIGAFMLVDGDDIAALMGIYGITTKHLPLSRRENNGSSARYEYTFDAEGRVSTIIIDSIWEGGSGSDRTEFTLHYGANAIPEHDYVPYLVKQEIADEGTLEYITEYDDTNTHYILPNGYTSYATIRSTLSNGTTRKRTETEPIVINPYVEGGWLMDYLFVTQGDIDHFKLLSTSLRKEPMEENAVNPHRYTYTLEYNCFTVELHCEVYYPYCSLYNEKSGQMEQHLMPMLPLNEECFITYSPIIEKIGQYEDQIDYFFRQKYLFQINKKAQTTEQDIQELNRNLYVKLQ